MSDPAISRRPIKARDSKWAANIAVRLARAGIRPNTISVLSACFAAGAGGCFALSSRFQGWTAAGFFLLGAVNVQLRLLCNLFDGMVAVEGGFRTKSGEVFNELPDRFADAFVLVGFGYAAREIMGGEQLGWSAAVLSVITAYIRALGGSTGAGQNFCGPMAKPHRMAAVTAASIVSTVAVFWNFAAEIMWGTLVLIILGLIVTIVRRTRWLIATLESK